MTVPYCRCGHARQLHTPTGRMDDTTERGHGSCTGWVIGVGYRCTCDDYQEQQR